MSMDRTQRSMLVCHLQRLYGHLGEHRTCSAYILLGPSGVEALRRTPDLYKDMASQHAFGRIGH